jgi:hypothetical protein
MTMKEQILQRIKNRPWTSFAGLSQDIPGFSGSLGMFVGDDADNVCIWPSLSQEAYDALSELLDEDAIYGKQTVALTYFIDSCVPKLPVARRDGKYKTPHWWPVVFNVGPAPAAAWRDSLRRRKRQESAA